jgi:hypothetical protein
MQANAEIPFDDLIKIIRALPPYRLKQLEAEIQTATIANTPGLEELLLSGPVATARQLKTIKNNRKAISKWRAK